MSSMAESSRTDGRPSLLAVGQRALDRPLIGISQSFHDFGDYGGVGVQRPVFAAGGLPLTLPQMPETAAAALDALDGLILAPGRDIEPWRYGAEPSPLLAAVEPRRDEFELALVPAALERGLPILGMCRGIQILNVALGGTLHQDVSLVAAGHATDPGWTAWKATETASLADEPPPPHPRHPIAVAAGSQLARALGTTSLGVNSYHHQAIDRLGDGLSVTATAPDGLIEAVELTGRPVLAVQWELQEEARVDSRFQAVFDWFVRVASTSRASAIS
jgi:gamma-glutamyl-gamma-aminobutyrate hydrolase PuuD